MNADRITVKLDLDASEASRQIRHLQREVNGVRRRPRQKWQIVRSCCVGAACGFTIDGQPRSLIVSVLVTAALFAHDEVSA